MLRGSLALSACLALAAGAAGCATQRPVLYPGQQVYSTPPEVVEADVEGCLDLARDHDAGPRTAQRVAGSTAERGVTGAAAGAAAGAVLGHAGRGAAAGGAGGGAAGLVRGLLRAGQPDPVQQRFVEICLRDKGYRVAGWR